MNSLGVNPLVYNLGHDLHTGIVILQLYDVIKKGTVDWRFVNMPPYKLAIGGRIKKMGKKLCGQQFHHQFNTIPLHNFTLQVSVAHVVPELVTVAGIIVG